MEGAQMNKIDTGIAELLAKQPSDGAEKDAYIAELQKTVNVNEYLSHFAEKWLKYILAFTCICWNFVLFSCIILLRNAEERWQEYGRY